MGTHYKYKVTGPRGAQYLTTTRKEAEKLTRNGGSFVEISPKAKKIKRIGGWTTTDRRGKTTVGYSRHRNPDPTPPYDGRRGDTILRQSEDRVLWQTGGVVGQRTKMWLITDYSGEALMIEGYNTIGFRRKRDALQAWDAVQGKQRNPLDRRLAGVMRQYGPVVAFITAEVVIPARNTPMYLDTGRIFLDATGDYDDVGPVEQLRLDMEDVDQTAAPFEDKLTLFITKALEKGKWYSEDASGFGEGAGVLAGRDFDRVIPWVALQVHRVIKGKIKPRPPRPNRYGRVEPTNPFEPLVRIHRKIIQVRDWVHNVRPSDLMRLTPNQVLRRSAIWHADFKRKQDAQAAVKEPGTIVHKYDDGWTVQQLITKAQLTAEGTSMAHCVGGYWASVREGRAEIFSIRDPEGVPHATVQINPDTRDAVQIYGPNDEDIKSESMCRRVWDAGTALNWRNEYDVAGMEPCMAWSRGWQRERMETRRAMRLAGPIERRYLHELTDEDVAEYRRQRGA